jgi:hypothetical protein
VLEPSGKMVVCEPSGLVKVVEVEPSCPLVSLCDGAPIELSAFCPAVPDWYACSTAWNSAHVVPSLFWPVVLLLE